MLSEETDNPGDSVPPHLEGCFGLSQFVENIGCLANGMMKCAHLGAPHFAFTATAQPSQEASAW